MPQAEQPATIERLLAIRALPLFSDVHLDELAVVAEHARPTECARGETLPAGIHLIVTGEVVEYRAGRPFRTHGPQHVVGGFEALALAASDTRLVCEQDTSTLAIGRSDLRDILEDNFGTLSAALQGVAASILRLRRQLPGGGFPQHDARRKTEPAALDQLWVRTAFLRAQRWLPAARIETLGHLAREASLVSIPDRMVLWREGEPADDAVMVIAGAVACTSTAGGHRFERGGGAILGLDEALAMEPRWYHATARAPLTALRLTRAAVLDALEDDPDTALDMLTTLARVASRLRDHVARATTRMS
ncbi:MAG TPA: cyclic nucleotide-binding domain-containing protein [Planctomycetota bacterium]|nr:cyclic nucleotide-binding domain-containing protein [Planctomycetota bacterium]